MKTLFRTKLGICIALVCMILSACSIPEQDDSGKVKKGDFITFGKYEQDNDYSNGKEDIEWLVLDVEDERALVVSKYALDCQPYNKSGTNVTWETSTIREWLNNDFLNAAFSDDEKTMIPTVTVSADKNIDFDTNPGNATQDQVFLLSMPEALKYLKTSKARQCKATDYVLSYDLYIEDSSNNCWWWLRSPGSSQDRAVAVWNDGDILNDFNTVNNAATAVRPAMWIDLTFDDSDDAIDDPNNAKVDDENKAENGKNMVIDSRFCEAQEGDTITFGKYEQDNDTSNGKEDIEWLVLEVKDEKVLLISKYGLDSKAFNDKPSNNSWEFSTLRKWLNNDFINEAFTDEEKAMIPTVTVMADINPYYYYTIDPGNDTQDQVFLLSIIEAEDYFNSDSERKCKPTDYAVANGAYKSYGYSDWWLRSPGYPDREGSYVNESGDTHSNGLYVTNDSTIVRPALYIDLSACPVQEQDNETANPAQVKFDNLKAKDTITFGKYEQDNNTSNGKEDIEWLVLDVKDGRALVISKYGLDCKRYTYSTDDVSWETSTLRAWLNHDFVNSAFSKSEKAMIPTVTVSADVNPYHDVNPGNDTQDQVFLLSVIEAEEYFDSDSERICQPTDYAVANGAYQSSKYKGSKGNCDWWLRSPGVQQTSAAYVYYINGEVGDNSLSVYKKGPAVRPALWIDLN